MLNYLDSRILVENELCLNDHLPSKDASIRCHMWILGGKSPVTVLASWRGRRYWRLSEQLALHRCHQQGSKKSGST
jgi:hypothetical protein